MYSSSRLTRLAGARYARPSGKKGLGRLDSWLSWEKMVGLRRFFCGRYQHGSVATLIRACLSNSDHLDGSKQSGKGYRGDPTDLASVVKKVELMRMGASIVSLD